MNQSELPFAPNLTPGKRGEPRLWVKEVAVYREWHPEALQRRIELRQGLNIIWAEPSEQGAGGHAAGKTTFCRFLRYLLGDANYGSEPFRDAFRVKFPNAWIVGEVYLDNEPWVLARFTGIIGPQHWSARGVSIKRLFDGSVERQTHADFVRALHKAFVAPLPIDVLPGSGKNVEWQHLFAWLSRDQEARYDHVLDWRSQYSGSGGLGDIHHADRTLLMRTMLGLTQPGEFEARREHMQILRDKADCETLLPKLEFARKRADTEYRRLMNLGGAEITESGLLVEENECKRENSRLLGRVRELRQQDGVGDVLPAERDDLVKQLALIVQKAKEMDADEKRVKLELDFQEGRVSDEEYRKQLAQMPLRADQCSAPLDLALRHKCALAQSLHPNRFSEHVLAELASTVGTLKTRVGILARTKQQLSNEQSEAERKKTDVDGRITAVRRRHLQNIQVFEDEAKSAGERLDATKRLRELMEELDTERKKLERLQTDQRKSTEAQDKLRQRASTQLSDFSEIFGALAGFVLQSDRRGAVRFLAEEVKLELDYNDLTSTALVTLKILLFDLAALFASARETEHHPGLLIHDSPREADLTATIYRRIFDAAKAEEPVDGPKPFQYIITTTEPPPDDLRRTPWLVHPPFSSAEKSRRFLGENL